MPSRITVALLLAAVAAGAADRSVSHLAAEAKRAQNAGQVVRAYVLYSEAAARDPRNALYATQRDALRPLAKLLTESHVQTTPTVDAALQAAEADEAATKPLPDADALQMAPDDLAPVPHVEAEPALHSFDIRADDRSILIQVAEAYGVEAVFDPAWDANGNRHFTVDKMDFATAMSGATAATGSFAFALGPRRIFIARDTEAKRSEFEPQMVITVDIPEALDQRDVVDAANTIRGVIGLRGTVAWSNSAHKIVIRDRVNRARAAAAILQELVLPKAQVAFDVELIAIDSDATYTYGVNWQTAYQVLPLGLLHELHNVIPPSIVNATTFLPVGGGLTLLGIGLTEANLFARYTATSSNVLFNATVVVGNGQTASLHVGDKYPIATALYSGFSQSSNAAAYNPIGQVNEEELGLQLKVAPHISADGNVRLDLEAEYKTLGNQPTDTVPSINQRAFKGSLTLQEGQWAVIGGMDEDDRSVSRHGFPGLGSIPALDVLFSQTSREHRKGQTLLLVKPRITRLPLSSDGVSAYLVGPARGSRTIF